MDYTLRELECFTAVAEELSFTRAARRLHLAQPPLSRHVRALEERLGVSLFERNARGVALTAAGGRFQEETRGLLTQLARAADMARRAAHGELERLRLGFVSAVLTSELVDSFRRFREKHAAVQILLHDLPPADQLREIAAGALDGGFVGVLPAGGPPGIQFTPWRQEKLAAFLPADHALAGRRDLALADLARERFVAVAGQAAPAFSAFVSGQCRAAGFRPRVILESSRAQAVAVMVAAGCGVALLPESLASIPGGGVAVIPLREAPVITHVFAHAAGETPAGVLRFMRLLR
ncbi:MAG: LysR substrate-binding domain-containing protein [Verrucomicrobiota bacterium]